MNDVYQRWLREYNDGRAVALTYEQYVRQGHLVRHVLAMVRGYVNRRLGEWRHEQGILERQAMRRVVMSNRDDVIRRMLTNDRRYERFIDDMRSVVMSEFYYPVVRVCGRDSGIYVLEDLRSDVFSSVWLMCEQMGYFCIEDGVREAAGVDDGLWNVRHLQCVIIDFPERHWWWPYEEMR